MSQTKKTGWNRRDFIGAAALLAVGLNIPAGATILDNLDQAEAPSARQISLMREVAQVLIPATDTPGAGDAGAGEFTILALAHGLEGTRQPYGQNNWVAPRHLRPDGTLRFVDWLEDVLDRAAGGNWLDAPIAQRSACLAACDTEAYGPESANHPWRKLKALILIGYYTSEAGGSQELKYAAIPGRFDPMVPVNDQTRAFSNDWSALEFG